MEKINIIDKIDELCKKYDRKDYPGMAIALLIEEGKLSLSQHITDIFPQLNECFKDITIDNLLHMTNGIPDVYDIAALVGGVREDEGITRDEFWKYALSFDWLLFNPGEQWSYGNTVYFLLGQIVEKAAGMSLSQYADEHIFKPLGMKNTFIRDDHTKIIKNRAVGYSLYEYVHFNHSYERYTTRNDKISINLGNYSGFYNDFTLYSNGLSDKILRLLVSIDEEENNNGQSDDDFSIVQDTAEEIIKKSENIDLLLYEGSYICKEIKVSYSVMKFGVKLLIRNENLRNDGMDLEYKHIKDDTFRCIPNCHKDDLYVMFIRNSDNEIISFIYENDTQNKFIFVKKRD